MIGHITAKIIHTEIEARRDADMENRNVGIEVVLELDMAVYEDEKVEILKDVYALDRKLTPVYRSVVFDNILMKNQSDLKLHQRIKIKNDQARILRYARPAAILRLTARRSMRWVFLWKASCMSRFFMWRRMIRFGECA